MENKKDFLVDKWLERFCSNSLYEGIRGDLEELFADECPRIGRFRARINYNVRAVTFFRLAFYQRKRRTSTFEAMWKNFMTITLRNLRKHKGYSFINIAGLAIGMTAGFLILQYVYYETTYDQFFPNKENIYRVQTDRYDNGALSTQWASGASGAGIRMKEEFPEVLDYVKLYLSRDILVRDRNFYSVEYPFFATPNFFKVFSIPLLQGNDSTALIDVGSVVLSKSLADKMFPDEDPMGKEIKTNNGAVFLVTGVFQDLPEKSHLKIDLLYSMSTWLAWVGGDEADRTWDWDGWTNYVVLQPGTDLKALEAKFPAFIKKIQTGDQPDPDYEVSVNFVLQPLPKIHLTSDYRAEIRETGDETATYFLLIIGAFVLFIAWINYINLTTARSLNRAREVGIRKVLGSYRGQLIGQFLFESTFTNLLAIGLSVVMVFIAFPYFNNFVGRPLLYTWPDATWFWTGLVGLILLGIFLSGFYPALILSGFRPVTVLKGKFTSTAKGNLMRKGLVVFQFLASIILITGTYIVHSQLGYLRNQDLGFNLDQTIIIESNKHYLDSISTPPYQVFKNKVTGESAVLDFCTSTSVPGSTPPWNAGGIRLIHQSEDEQNQYRVIGADDQYIPMFGLELLAGRAFDRSYGDERSSLICNEAGMKRLGFENPEEVLNQKVFFWGDTFNVIGVVKNFRQESPKTDFDALLFRYAGEAPQQLYSVRISGADVRGTVESIEAHWKDAYGERPFNFYFLDDHYNTQYKAESQFGSIFGIFSGLAILVACMGLFGLASYMTSLRMKEVSIRKVLGASFSELWLLLTNDFVKLVGLAILIAIFPIWYFMNNWLNNFANRIDLSWWLFALPALILLVIAIGTISYHTFSTIHSNPAQTLKDE